MTKPRYVSSRDISDETIIPLSAEELIVNIFRDIQQLSTYSYTMTNELVNGAHGFVNDQQRVILEGLHNHIQVLHHLFTYIPRRSNSSEIRIIS